MVLSLRRDFGLVNSLETKRPWRLLKWTECVLHYDMAMSLWGQGIECSGLKENNSHGLVDFEYCVGGAVWQGLGSVSLLRRCVMGGRT